MEKSTPTQPSPCPKKDEKKRRAYSLLPFLSPSTPSVTSLWVMWTIFKIIFDFAIDGGKYIYMQIALFPSTWESNCGVSGLCNVCVPKRNPFIFYAFSIKKT